jgi:hypothetical protein
MGRLEWRMAGLSGGRRIDARGVFSGLDGAVWPGC